jgi:hypothetical protein
METKKINRLMYKSAMNDVDRTKDMISYDDLWVLPIPSLAGAIQLETIRKFVFGLPGR